MTPAEQIQKILAHPDWNESKLAAFLNVTQPTVNRIKNGLRLPSYPLSQRIAQAYDGVKRTKAVREAVL